MSKLIATAAIRGAHQAVTEARSSVERVMAEKGPDCPVSFPNTAYFLPIAYSHLGLEISTVAAMRQVLDTCDDLLPQVPLDTVWLPYLGDTLNAGMATLLAFELIEACKTVIGPSPVQDLWLGAADDVIMRERGVEFVDGSAPGFAAIVGCAPDADTAVALARELQSKNLYVFMAGNVNGVSFAEQLASKGVQLGWNTRLVPFGKDTSAAIHALSFASRAALSFGGVKKGDYEKNLRYNKNRIFAFVLALGEVDDEKYAAAAGCINYGFPTIADTDIPQILPSGICTYEHVVSNVPCDQIVARALEIRGCKIKITEIPIPVSYGAAFEGERIRKEQVHVEFGGTRTAAFEYCTTREMDEIDDGMIKVVGKEADEVEPGTQLPLGIWVEVAGRKMQSDFEPILERQVHHLINQAEGIWHMGQRDIIWVRISTDAFKRGFRIRHLGEILRAKLLSDYPAIVDKVAITIYTDPAEVDRLIVEARRVYRERNLRLASLTDENVDLFYSCLLCQSFAPNHVCVITPERLGLCGAYNWLDGKAAYEIDPTGPNQPLTKGECLDPVRGIWSDINDYVFKNSNQSIGEIAMYSIMHNPMTSCGCFEVILAVVPELNGVIAVNREFPGETPVGMKFSTLAGTVGGGQQTPGFMGCGKTFLTSRKFLATEGGIRRLVWMPRQLKDQLHNDLVDAMTEAGCPELIDLIADETAPLDIAGLRKVLEERNHPALTLWDVTGPSPEASAWDAEHSREYSDSAPSAPVVASSAPPSTTAAVQTAPTVVSPHVPEGPVEIPPVPAQNAPVDECINYTRAILHNLLQQKTAAAADPQRTIAAGMLRDTATLLHALGSRPALQVSPAPAANEAPPAPSTASEMPAVTLSPRQSAAPASVTLPSTVTCPVDSWSGSVHPVTIGGSGTRTSAITIGGAASLPLRSYEGNCGHRPALTMEVFDTPPERFPDVLRDYWGDKLGDPAAMARHCVEVLGAQAISVRCLSCHPDKGDRSAEAASDTVRSVLEAVGVPVIVTGPGHFEKTNELMKRVAADFSDENLLLNWTETDNYRTIAGAAMGYNHCVVTQTPIDVNMAKQLNILLTSMGVKPDKIIIDPLTGALGYGLEYSYSVMERIRLSALGGDPMLQMPMLVTPGFETAKCKEANADTPQWGDRKQRGALLETATAMALLQSGADLLILYYPEAVAALRRTITRLGDHAEGRTVNNG
ncbi:MAG: CO dehydrogenase/CO-methylating acetyl-CoA synthase complex subunit beta [Chitinispirillaceae bacterium]|nr:CO dehydrogenase/CO-methylating acetyl-CoA synthase complex subunit beta [Chitinispirillaceae bacterium]